MTEEQAKALYEESRRIYASFNLDIDPRTACLYWAAAALMAASKLGFHQLGINFMPRAGTASWYRVPPELDDGECMNAFSYVFEDNKVNRLRFENNLLPEMHVWVVDAASLTFFDATTGFQPDRCRELDEWLNVQPDPYACFQPGNEPDWVAGYTADPVASLMALKLIADFLEERFGFRPFADFELPPLKETA